MSPILSNGSTPVSKVEMKEYVNLANSVFQHWVSLWLNQTVKRRYWEIESP